MEQTTNTQVAPFSAITEVHINDWKAKYGADSLDRLDVTIGSRMVPDPEKPGELKPEVKYASFVLRTPGRVVLEVLADYAKQNKTAEANKVLLANTVLGGDMDKMEADVGVYGAVLAAATEKVKRKPAELKKL